MELHASSKVEIFYDDAWHVACNTSWNLKTATFVCQKLGFEDLHVVQAKKTQVGIYNVSCKGGNNTNMLLCPFSSWIKLETSEEHLHVHCKLVYESIILVFLL